MQFRIVTAGVALAALVLAFAPAEAKKLGKEFQVSKDGFAPDVAKLSDGGFVVVWRGEAPYGVDAQRFDKTGKKVGGKITVVGKSPEPTTPAVAAFDNGSFVVVWEDEDGSGLGIRMQRFNKNGAPVGSKVRVNKYKTDDQQDPVVAVLKNGSFIVLWSSVGQDGTTSAAIGQRFKKNGTKIGGEFRVDGNVPAGDFHDSLAVAALSKGGFVAAWRAYHGIKAQRFSASAGKVGDEFRVNPDTFTGQFDPAIGATDTGFVIARESVNEDGDVGGIFAQRYKNNGGTVGGNIKVPKPSAGTQGNPDVAGLGNGGFVIVWDGTSIVDGQLFGPDGKRVGGNFKINTTAAPSATVPTVAPNGAKGFVVAWWSALSGILGQRFDGK